MRTLTRFIAFAVFLAASALPAAAMPGPLADLQTELRRVATHVPAKVGIAITDLATGETSAVNASANMPAASTIKVPVMVEVFRQMSLGNFDLNRTVTLMAGDRDWGWGELCNARVGSRYDVARLLQLMIDDSDNTATNMLIRLVGRQRVNATMADLGLLNTRLADYIRSADSADIRSLRTSPADMVHLLASIAREQVIDPWSSREMIAILSRQHHNTLLPAPLPPGLQIAHKTGSLSDTLNDVGIVFFDREPYAIAVMTTNLPSLDMGRSFIRNVSKLAYNAFNRFADWRDGLSPNPEIPVWRQGPPSTAAAPATAATPQPGLDWEQ